MTFFGWFSFIVRLGWLTDTWVSLSFHRTDGSFGMKALKPPSTLAPAGLAKRAKAKSPYFASLIVLLAAWVWLFWDHFPNLLQRWNSEDLSYCALIPVIAAYLAYHNLQNIRGMTAGGAHWPGILILAFSGFVYLAGRLGSLETLVYGAMWFFLIGVLITSMGALSLQKLGFPLLVLAFAVPPPPLIVRTLSFNLRLVSSKVSMAVFHGLNIPAFRDGNIIDMGTAKLQMVDACSGLRYFFPAMVIGLVMGHLFRLGLWQRIVLLACCLPLLVASNMLRIVTMGIGARHGVNSLLEGPVHDLTGIVPFVLVTFALGGLAWGLARLQPIADLNDGPAGKSNTSREHKTCSRPAIASYTAAGCVLFIGTWLLSSLLLSAGTPPSRQSFSTFPTRIGLWSGELTRLSPRIEEGLWADDYVTGIFEHTESGSRLSFLVPYYQSQTVRHTAHAPTTCLLGSGFSLHSKNRLEPSPGTGRDFPVTQMVLSRHDGRVLSNFWFEQRGRIIANEYLNKFFLFWDGLTRQRTDGALVRVEMTLAQNQSVEKAQTLLDPFLGGLRNVLISGFVPR